MLFVVGLVGSLGFAAYRIYTNMQDDIVQLSQQNSALDRALRTSRETVGRLEANMEIIEQQNSRLARALEESETDLDNLRTLLIEHDLTRLALERPGLIERRINDATKDLFDQLEFDTGADSVR